MTIISHEKKFIFIHPKKCAGDSITHALREYGNVFNTTLKNNSIRFEPTYYNMNGIDNDVKNLTITNLIDDVKHWQITPEIYKDYYKFSVTRNPWDRVVSFYSSASKKKVFMKNGLLTEGIKKVRSPLPVMEHIIYKGDKTEHIDFDYIIEFENLQEGFDKVCDDLNIPRSRLEHINKSAHRSYKNYKRYYKKEVREHIKEKFEEDIKKFGYGFYEKHINNRNKRIQRESSSRIPIEEE